MIQQEHKNSVEQVNGNIATTGFSIEINESMFQLLTANVYNDTIMAVMREWSTNACDACIAAGKEVKFDVHIPTNEEPTFFVRDYGTGLAPEDVIGVFSNLGASTKRGSNLYNGTLGIGRMAGLAVSNAFTVESFYEGKKYSYVISMQKGIPVTMHLGDSDTEEPNGLKLSVAVDYSDISYYYQKIEDLYKYFDHKPNLNVKANVEIDFSGNISGDWFIDTAKHTYSTRNKVVMSQVAYEIPPNSAIEDFGFRSLVIKVPPGSVTFNPGRESLSLNKETISFINSKFKTISEEYVEKANNAMVLCNNDYDLFKAYSQLVKGMPSKISKLLDPSIYMSQEAKNLFTHRSYYSGRSSSTNPSYEYFGQTQKFNTATLGLVALHHKASYYKTFRDLDENNCQSYAEFFTSHHVVVDVKTKFKTAISSHFDNSSIIMWVRPKGVEVEESVAQAEKYLKILGIPYILASSIAKEETGKVLPMAAPREGFYAGFLDGTLVTKSRKMEEEECQKQTYLYLKVKQSTPQLADINTGIETYQALYTFLSHIVYMPPVKCVPMKYQNYVDSMDNWVDYETFIKDKIKTIEFKHDLNHDTFIISPLVADNNIGYFPKDIAEYYSEVVDRHAYKRDKKYVWDTDMENTLKTFGGTFAPYTPKHNINESALSGKYKLAFPLIRGEVKLYGLDSAFLIELAKLESFHAIHSAGQ